MELGSIHVWVCLECVPVPVSELGVSWVWVCVFTFLCVCVCTTRLSKERAALYRFFLYE